MKELEVFKGKVVNVEVQVQDKDREKERLRYYTWVASKPERISVTFKHKDDILVVDIVDKLPKEVKDFLETNEFCSENIEYTYIVLLKYGVRVNLVSCVSKDASEVPILLQIYKKDMWGYENSIILRKLAMELAYNRVNTHIDSKRLQERILVYEDEEKKLSSKVLKEYGCRTAIMCKWYIRDKIKAIEKAKGTPLTEQQVYILNTAQNIQLLKLKDDYPELTDIIDTYIALRRVKQKVGQLYRIKNKNSADMLTITKMKRQCIASVALYPIAKKDLSIFNTNEKKHYYITITASRLELIYAISKLMGNKNIDKVMYQLNLASEVFNKAIDKVTKVELELVKRVLFERLLPNYYSSNIKGYKNTELEILDVNPDARLEKIPTFNKEINLRESLDKLQAEKQEILYKELVKGGLNGITPAHISGDEYMFRVSNKVNPYRAMKKINDILDTTEDIGLRLFDTFSLGNDLYEANEFQFRSITIGEVHVNKPRITYDAMIEKYNSIEEEQLRFVVKQVQKDFK